MSCFYKKIEHSGCAITDCVCKSISYGQGLWFIRLQNAILCLGRFLKIIYKQTLI